MKSVRAVTLLPAPTIRGLRIARISRTSNVDAEASRKHVYKQANNACALSLDEHTYPHKLSIVATFSTNPEICEVSNRQESASDKRFSIKYYCHCLYGGHIPPHKSVLAI